MRFISRLALLLMAGFLVEASQVWTGDTLQWLFFGAGVAMILAAAADAVYISATQRALDGLIVVLGASTVIGAFVFEASLRWWSFGAACALAALAGIGLALHIAPAIDEFGATTGREDRERAPRAT